MAVRGSPERVLLRMYKKLQDNPSSYFSCSLVNNDPFQWRCDIIGPEKSPYEGGVFPAILVFPPEFPVRPPKMRFICPMWHPNIHEKTGEVCISILHEPGKDPLEYELCQERWLPIHTVETIVVSVISMLLDPNCESPLNLNAAKECRSNREEYDRKVRANTQRLMESSSR